MLIFLYCYNIISEQNQIRTEKIFLEIIFWTWSFRFQWKIEITYIKNVKLILTKKTAFWLTLKIILFWVCFVQKQFLISKKILYTKSFPAISKCFRATNIIKIGKHFLLEIFFSHHNKSFLKFEIFFNFHIHSSVLTKNLKISD